MAAVPCYAARSAIQLTSLTAGSTKASAWKTTTGASRRAATSSLLPWIGGWTRGASSALQRKRSRGRYSTPRTPLSISSVSVCFKLFSPSVLGKQTLLSENCRLTEFHNGNEGVHPVSGSKKQNKSQSIK